jgi:acyl-CoA thioesterase-1
MLLNHIKKIAFILLLVLPLSKAIVYASEPVVVDNTLDQSILVLGDSISAAYGISREQSWVNLLDIYLKQHFNNQKYTIINASISGETTGGALTRLPKLLSQHKPNVVIIELGGNDGLRGYPIKNFRANLDQLVELSRQAKAEVLVTGMRIPPNYGPRYTQMFYDSYGIIAQKYSVSRVPFLLEEIALQPQLMQKDGIHPTAEAQSQILQNVLPYLKEILSFGG